MEVLSGHSMPKALTERASVDINRIEAVHYMDDLHGDEPRFALVSMDGALTWLTTNPGDLIGLQNAHAVAGVVGPSRTVAVSFMKSLVEKSSVNVPSIEATLADISEEELASIENLNVSGGEETVLKDAALKAPVVRIVNAVLAEAHRKRASDIHFEPTQDAILLRYRIDGVLYEQVAPPISLYPAIISRIKILAGLNIAEKRLPQDGRIRMRLDTGEVDVRVATAPSVFGESVALRLLDEHIGLRTPADLGLSKYDLDRLSRVFNQTDGIILVTGPTGGGKTTTLYAMLRDIRSPRRKIITLEDPIEYEMAGITQIQVRPRIGFTFATGLRSLLRHDPDVLLVGEIRDLETAEMAVNASLTGHLVLSSLHTNDAPGALIRLIDMGVEPYLISATVRAVVGQRLVRVLCTHCRVAQGEFYKAGGCPACDESGYIGRIAIFETLICDEGALADALIRPSAERLRQFATESGMRTLSEDGMEKARRGITTPDEVRRVIGSRYIEQDGMAM